MNVKKRTKPMKWYFNVAILGRIFANHPKIPEIENDNRRSDSGHRGEERLDFFLDQLPEKDYYIFQGLRLPNANGNSHFQIDSFVFNSTNGIINEAKNLKGELTFEKNQLIQKYDDKQFIHEDPILQAKFQVHQLKELLRKHQFPNLPLEFLVMMSNSSAELKIPPDSEAQFRVCRGRQVVFKIEEFTSKYKEEKLDRETIRKLCKFLLKKHTEPIYDIEKIYKIPRSDLRTGVHCPECRSLPMKYYQGSWLCQRCKCKSRDAHLTALRDYYLLFGPAITNQQFREFLHIDSINVASKMLKKLNLPYTNSNKNRVYQLSFEY